MIRTLASVAALVALASRTADAAELRADTSASTVTVRVGKSGFLSAFGHEHAFSPDRWGVDASFDPGRPSDLRVAVAIDAGSLHDHERGLSQEDRAKVDRQAAGPDVLDARRFPEIRYDGAPGEELRKAPDGTLQGVLHGTLSLHGVARPLDVPFSARPAGGGWLASGAAKFKQSDFGVKPPAAAGGAVGVRDEVKIEFRIALRPDGTPAARSAQREANPGLR